MSQTRKVAVIGGNRIPFVKSNAQYAEASNQQMLTATLKGLVDRYNLRGERLGEVAAGAVIKHSRDFNLTRESVLDSGLARRDPRLRRAAGLWHRSRGRHPGRQQDRARPDRGPPSPAAPTPPATRPSASSRGPAQDPAQGQPRQDAQRSACSRSRTSRPRTSMPLDPLQRRAAHRPVHGRPL